MQFLHERPLKHGRRYNQAGIPAVYSGQNSWNSGRTGYVPPSRGKI